MYSEPSYFLQNLGKNLNLFSQNEENEQFRPISDRHLYQWTFHSEQSRPF